MSMFTYRPCLTVFVLVLLFSPLESTHGSCELSVLTCDNVDGCKSRDDCDQYDPAGLNSTLQRARNSDQFDIIVKRFKCKVFESKSDLCKLKQNIKSTIRPRCSK